MSEIDTSKWQAFLSEPYGWVYTGIDEFKERGDTEVQLSIRRRSALPYLADADDPDSLRIPGDWNPVDLFIEMDMDLDESDFEVLAERWELAQRAAWGMNQHTDATGNRPELPWALKTGSGWNRIWVAVVPSLDAPAGLAAVSVRGMTGEFTADELEQCIAAMSEAVRQIRAHASVEDLAGSSSPESMEAVNG